MAHRKATLKVPTELPGLPRADAALPLPPDRPAPRRVAFPARGYIDPRSRIASLSSKLESARPASLACFLNESLTVRR